MTNKSQGLIENFQRPKSRKWNELQLFHLFLFWFQGQMPPLKIPFEGIWFISSHCHSVKVFMLSEAIAILNSCQLHWKSQHPWEFNLKDSTLKVAVISISVLIISVCKLGILLSVWDSSEWGVVIETRVKNFIHDVFSFFSADVPHS